MTGAPADAALLSANIGAHLDDAASRNLTPALISVARGADARAPVAPRSVRLCASLGELAGVVYDALSPAPDEDARMAVTEAAAALAILTKFDDQVIDGRAFHGGANTPRESLRRTTTAYLAPTLDSLRTARPRYDEPRCAPAAFAGQRLRSVARDDARLASYFTLVSRGWDSQVDSVETFTSHPSTVSAAKVSRVSSRTSMLWLSMISAVGALPLATPSRARPRWLRGMLRWGRWIHRADALADLSRDLDDALLSNAVMHALWTLAPSAFDDAVRRRDHAALFALVGELEVDVAMRPPPGALDRVSRDLSGLGDLSSHLGWMHSFLLGRYETHPLRAPRRDPSS